MFCSIGAMDIGLKEEREDEYREASADGDSMT
jgi:hypothetical protein